MGETASARVGQILTLQAPNGGEWQVDWDEDRLRLLTVRDRLATPGPAGWRWEAIQPGDAVITITSRPACATPPCPPNRAEFTYTVTIGAEAPLQAWERAVDGVVEHLGIGRVEQLGNRWVLTVYCDGTHSTYLDTTTLDLQAFGSRYVRARYRYEERENPDTQCVRAPCPPARERLVAVQQLTIVAATADDAAASARQCRRPGTF
jgi:hypothetical protein